MAEKYYDTRLKIILREGLEPWQEMNITAFLMTGMGASHPEIVGEPYVDASGEQYLPMSRQPIIILTAPPEEMQTIVQKVNNREDVEANIYVEELFDTFNDEDNREMTGRFKTEDLNLVGIAVYGPKNPVDRITKHANAHG